MRRVGEPQGAAFLAVAVLSCQLDLPVAIEGRVVCGITLIIQKICGVAPSQEPCRPGIASNEWLWPRCLKGAEIEAIQNVYA